MQMTGGLPTADLPTRFGAQPVKGPGTGEPCAVKAACTVWEGADGKRTSNGTSSAAYFTRRGTDRKGHSRASRWRSTRLGGGRAETGSYGDITPPDHRAAPLPGILLSELLRLE